MSETKICKGIWELTDFLWYVWSLYAQKTTNNFVFMAYLIKILRPVSYMLKALAFQLSSQNWFIHFFAPLQTIQLLSLPFNFIVSRKLFSQQRTKDRVPDSNPKSNFQISVTEVRTHHLYTQTNLKTVPHRHLKILGSESFTRWLVMGC